MKKIIIIFIFALIGSTCFAGTDGTWKGGAVAPSWQAIDNWVGVQPGGEDAVVTWSPINSGNNTCVLGNDASQHRSCGTMYFTASNTAGFNIDFYALIGGDPLNLTMLVSSGSAYIKIHEDVGDDIVIGRTGGGFFQLNDDLIIEHSNTTENLSFDRPIIDNEGNNCVTLDGVGTVVFSSSNTYAGGTFIQDGTLSLTGDGTLGDASGSLYITTGGILNIETGVSATVQFLVLDGLVQEAGTWGSTSSSADYQNDTYFSGTGKVTVSSSYVVCEISCF